MTRRYSVKAVTERVLAGGDYDEWFDLRKSVGLGDTLEMAEYTTNQGRINHLLRMMIVDWSLCDDAGVKLPVNADTIASLDVELIAPVISRMNDMAASFLALQSAIEMPK